jgi:hypothetical protein
MCDYSLHTVASRPARVGDQLVSTRFRNSITRGFATASEPDVAVCLMPGTEVAFERDVEVEPAVSLFRNQNLKQKVARFREVETDRPYVHHDALEFPDGQVALVTSLVEGQRLTVLQLPAAEHPAKQAAAEETREESRDISPAAV